MPQLKVSTYNTSIVLEVQVDTISPAPGLALADDNGGHDLLAELGLSLLDGGHDHVTDTGSRETVEAGTDTGDGDDVQVASTRVVAAVHHGATVRQKRIPLALRSFQSKHPRIKPLRPMNVFELGWVINLVNAGSR